MQTKQLRQLLLWVLLAGSGATSAQTPGPWQFDLSIGVHTYFMPGIGARLAAPRPVIMAGVARSLNKGQTLQAAFNIGYTRNKYQGDGLFTQTQLRWQPRLGRFEPGVGAGIGYQWCFYPSPPLNWDGNAWTSGRRWKGALQVPVHLRLGYRAITTAHSTLTPYLAWQTNVLFGYSPDLSPLPVSALLGGIAITPNR